MNIEDVKKLHKKDIIMTIRTSKDKSKWMKDHNISPSLLFDKALEELIKTTKENGDKE